MWLKTSILNCTLSQTSFCVRNMYLHVRRGWKPGGPYTLLRNLIENTCNTHCFVTLLLFILSTHTLTLGKVLLELLSCSSMCCNICFLLFGPCHLLLQIDQREEKVKVISLQRVTWLLRRCQRTTRDNKLHAANPMWTQMKKTLNKQNPTTINKNIKL